MGSAMLRARSSVAAVLAFRGFASAEPDWWPLHLPFTPAPCADVAEARATAIPDDAVEHHLKYARTGDKIPELFHGIHWMDQTGYYLTRPDRPETGGEYETFTGQKDWYREFPHNLRGAYPELLASFGGDDVWNEDTKCARVNLRADHWTYVNTLGPKNLGSAMWQVVGSHLYNFCISDEDPNEIKIMFGTCNGTDPQDFRYEGQSMIKRPWGFERLNHAWGMSKKLNQNTIAQRYAVYQIVDGEGKRTRHYDVYLEFMKQRCWDTPEVSMVPTSMMPECSLRGLKFVNAGGGTQIMGKTPGSLAQERSLREVKSHRKSGGEEDVEQVDVGSFMQASARAEL